jgi:alpha-tubulin suppressor-like RCC1 family protein
MPILSQGGCLKSLFVTEEELIDRFTGQELWLWGCNSTAKLGDNTSINRSSPVQTISGGTDWKSVSIGGCHSAGIKTDGTLWLWGQGACGILGNSSTIDRSSPVQTISGGNNWKNVSLGTIHSAAIKSDGTLWIWGSGGVGALGTNDTISRSSPVQTISGGTNWKGVSLGANTSAAIKTDGTLWLWGSGGNGQLGTGNRTSVSSPVQTISGGNNWKSISLSTGTPHAVAIKTDGTLWSWGRNADGQVGVSGTTEQLFPTQTIAGGNNWKFASAGCYSSAAIKTDGTLWLWGTGDNGRLGNNSLSDVSSAVQTVAGGNNWRSVSTFVRHTAAIKTDGTLWIWGSGGGGVLGTNDTINRSSPVQTISGGTNWRTVCAGGVATTGQTAATCVTEF